MGPAHSQQACNSACVTRSISARLMTPRTLICGNTKEEAGGGGGQHERKKRCSSHAGQCVCTHCPRERACRRKQRLADQSALKRSAALHYTGASARLPSPAASNGYTRHPQLQQLLSTNQRTPIVHVARRPGLLDAAHHHSASALITLPHRWRTPAPSLSSSCWLQAFHLRSCFRKKRKCTPMPDTFTD